MRSIPHWLVAGVLALIAGLTSSCAPRTHINDHLAYAPAPGFHGVETPPGSATVVFLRPDYMPYWSASILDGEKFVTILTHQTYFVYVTTPGTHQFLAHVTRFGPSYIDAELSPGKVYVVAVKWLESGWRGWYQLIPIRPDGEYWGTLPAWLAASKQVQPKPSAIGWFGENRENLLRDQSQRTAPDSRMSKLLPSDGVSTLPR